MAKLNTIFRVSFWLNAVQLIVICVQIIKIAVVCHDDIINGKHFPRYWPFVRVIHRSPVDFRHKGQWRGALTFSLTFADQTVEEHQWETFSALLALCEGNPPVTSGLPSQRLMARSFDVFYDLCWTNGGANNRSAGDLRRHRTRYGVTVMVVTCPVMQLGPALNLVVKLPMMSGTLFPNTV